MSLIPNERTSMGRREKPTFVLVQFREHRKIGFFSETVPKGWLIHGEEEITNEIYWPAIPKEETERSQKLLKTMIKTHATPLTGDYQWKTYGVTIMAFISEYNIGNSICDLIGESEPEDNVDEYREALRLLRKKGENELEVHLLKIKSKAKKGCKDVNYLIQKLREAIVEEKQIKLKKHTFDKEVLRARKDAENTLKKE